MKTASPLDRLRAEWDARARADALGHAHPASEPWTPETFFASGERTYVERVEPLVQQSTPADRVLDLGCGPGRLIPALARRFGQVHGVDISAAMVAKARELGAGASATLHVGDGMSLQCVRRHEFTLALVIDVLDHVEDSLRPYILRQVGKRLAAGGSCVVEAGAPEAAVLAWFAHTGLEPDAPLRLEQRTWVRARRL